MNKAELIDEIARKSGVTKKDITTVVNKLLDVVQDTVANGDKVVLVGFGSFERRDRQARKGHNPKTGEDLDIPATSVPAFSAGKNFKEFVANK